MTLRTVYLRLYRVAAVVAAAAGLGACLLLPVGPSALTGATLYVVMLVGLGVCVAGPLLVELLRLSAPRLGILFFFPAAAGGAALAAASGEPVGRVLAIVTVVAAFPVLLAATLLRAESSLNQPRNRL